MGTALGSLLRRHDIAVVTTVADRGPATAERARAAGFDLLDDLDAVVGTSGLLLSIVPPGVAPQVADHVAAACLRTEAAPVLVDLNAVAPGTVTAIARRLAEAGVQTVDGSISGPPPDRPGTTMVYLSGPDASALAHVLGAGGLDVTVLGDEVGTASALKMCTAAIYKGMTGIVAQSLATARAHDLADQVVADLRRSLPDAMANALIDRVGPAVPKAHRFVAEMREIAATQADAGQVGGLYEAMAEVFARLAEAR